MTEPDPMNPDSWPLVEEPLAPEVLVDGYQSAMLANGNVKMVFFTLEFDPVTQTHRRRIVHRLTMPVGVAFGVAESLSRYLEGMKAEMAAQQRSGPQASALN